MNNGISEDIDFVAKGKSCYFCVLCGRKGKTGEDIDHMPVCEERQKRIESTTIEESIKRIRDSLKKKTMDR